MSTILEALKKLEADKAAKQAAHGMPAFEPQAAPQDLLADAPRSGGSSSFPISLRMALGGAVAIIAGLATVSAVVSLVVVRSLAPEPASPPPPSTTAAAPLESGHSGAATQATASLTPQPSPATTEVPAETDATETGSEETSDPLVTASVSALANPSLPPAEQEPAREEIPPPLPMPPPGMVSDPVPAIAPPPPEELPIEEDTEPVAPPRVDYAVPSPWTPEPAAPSRAASKKEPVPADVRVLPPLGAATRARLGLENMKINALRTSGPDRAYPLALVNLNKVYVGEHIPGTTAKLIGVREDGMGIEIEGTGERFFVQH